MLQGTNLSHATRNATRLPKASVNKGGLGGGRWVRAPLSLPKLYFFETPVFTVFLAETPVFTGVLPFLRCVFLRNKWPQNNKVNTLKDKPCNTECNTKQHEMRIEKIILDFAFGSDKIQVSHE